MSKNQKIGVILVLVGIGLPLVLFPFASKYNPKRGLLGSIGRMKIVLREGEYVPPPGETIYGGYYKGRIELPYKYPLVLGIILICTGTGLIILSKPKSDKA